MSDNKTLKWIDDGSKPAAYCDDESCTFTQDSEINPLFTPYTLGSLQLRNRFALAPMGRHRSPGGVPSQEMVDYYVARAANGGAGLIITESTGIDHPSVGSKIPTRPQLRRGPGEAGHAALAEAVHAAGSAIFVQLWHPGAHDLGPEDSTQAVSPSGHWPVSGAVGHAAFQKEIDELIYAYADAAALAEKLGYDGVEVHGAHGFLIDQFLWTGTNRRNDQYGGSPAGRARFASEGADIAITYNKSKERADTIADEIRQLGRRAEAIPADAADASQVIAAVDKTFDHFGRLDILVNNAGNFVTGTIDQLTLEDYERSMSVNLRAVFAATMQAVKHLPDGGRIISIGSSFGTRTGGPGVSLYATSKSALIGLTKGVAQDLGKRRITVNLVQPGPTDTDMNPASGELASTLAPMLAQGAYGRPEDIASTVLYLASDGAQFITGAVIDVDGGFCA